MSLTNEAAQLVETTCDGASGAGLDEDVPECRRLHRPSMNRQTGSRRRESVQGVVLRSASDNVNGLDSAAC